MKESNKTDWAKLIKAQIKDMDKKQDREINEKEKKLNSSMIEKTS